MRVWYDTFQENPEWALRILSDDVSEALFICRQILKQANRIDPHSDLGAPRLLLQLDRAKIYGNDIIKLYKLCNNNLVALCSVLRAYDLGIIEATELINCIAGNIQPDVAFCNSQVREFLLGKFAKLEI